MLPFCMIVVVVICLLLDERGSVESCFVVLHHHLARTCLQIARYYDDQAAIRERLLCNVMYVAHCVLENEEQDLQFYMVMESGFQLDEMGFQELCSETWYWPQAHTLPRSGLHRVLCGDQAEIKHWNECLVVDWYEHGS